MFTTQAETAMAARTAAWPARCFTGEAVISFNIEDAIIMVKITPTMEFSMPNTFWNTVTKVIIKIKSRVANLKFFLDFPGRKPVSF